MMLSLAMETAQPSKKFLKVCHMNHLLKAIGTGLRKVVTDFQENSDEAKFGLAL